MCFGLEHCKTLVGAIKKHNQHVYEGSVDYRKLSDDERRALAPPMLRGKEGDGSHAERYGNCPNAEFKKADGRGVTRYHCSCVGYDPSKGYANKLPKPQANGLINELVLDDLVQYAVCPACRRKHEDKPDDHAFDYTKEKSAGTLKLERKARDSSALANNFSLHSTHPLPLQCVLRVLHDPDAQVRLIGIR